MPPTPQEMYRSFVREFARSPQKAQMLDRLRQGHQPDENGWCDHPSHAHHWERHPCSTLQLTTFVDTVDGIDRGPQPDADAGAEVGGSIPQVGGSAIT